MDRVRFGFFAAVALLTPSFGVLSTSPAVASAAHRPTASEPSATTRSVDTGVTASAGSAQSAPPDIRELDRTRFTLNGRPLPKPHYRPRVAPRRAAAATPAVGTVRNWLGLDDTTGKYYGKSYTLRAVGKHIEVRRNHLSEGDDRVQHAASARRVGRRDGRRLHR
jgi:hypothetical protein